VSDRPAAAVNTVTLHLVRHGETAHNAERRFQHPDTPLSDTGRAQAAAVAEKLAGLDAKVILASDYARAFETANIIATRLRLPVTVEPALRERNFGVLRGQLYADLGEEYVRSVYTGWDTGIDDGESWADVHARIATLFARLRASPPARELILVTHGGALNVALHCLSGAPVDAFVLQRLENCALRTVELARD
jgi:broad specificity phosphatase PhoE